MRKYILLSFCIDFKDLGLKIIIEVLIRGNQAILNFYSNKEKFCGNSQSSKLKKELRKLCTH